MKMKITLLASWLLCSTSLTFAQPGTLDNTFGAGGKVTTLVGGSGNHCHAYATAIQPDGKILVAGDFLNSNGNTDFVVIRYKSNGTLDSSFAGNGKAAVDFGVNATPYGIALQNDGKIVVAGGKGNSNPDLDFAIARLTSNGLLDNTFGSNGTGKVTTDFGGADGARAIALQQDGKIVVAGSTFKFDDDYSWFVTARYNSNGMLDNTFGTGGKIKTSVGNYTYSGASSVVIQADGKIVEAGYYDTDGGEDLDFAAVRYNINGTLDNTFAGSGKAGIHFDNHGDEFWDPATSIAINKSNGQIVLAGFVYLNYDSLYIAVTKLGPLGKPVSNFGVSGKVITQIGRKSQGNSVAIQADGKIVVAGFGYNTNYDFALVRYDSNGILDNTFGTNGNGIVTTGFGHQEYGQAVSIQQDGKIVVAGFSETTTGNVGDIIALARYNGDPSSLTANTETISAVTDKKLSNSSTIKLFPNPVKNLLNIDGMDASSAKTISIVNINGRVIQTTTTSNSTHTWNIASLPAGAYYLLIADKKKTMSLEFVKE
jgi:uncharacterized delta-60 repeat protein